VDVALDLVGGKDTSALIATLRQGGLLLAVPDGADDSVKAEAVSRGVRVVEPLVEPDGHALEEIAKLVGSGELKVIVSETFPLERAAAAHDRLERGGIKGKLVLEVGHD
jgi:NADPH:quinone reductase-like Zn-dependent oxidoreductase